MPSGPDIYRPNYLPKTDHVIKVPQVRNLMRPGDRGKAALKRSGAGCIAEPLRTTRALLTLYDYYLLDVYLIWHISFFVLF